MTLSDALWDTILILLERRPNPGIVRNVAHESSATWGRCVVCGAGHKTVLYCAINTDGPRMTMDLLCETQAYSFSFKVRLETSIHLDS